ncbi:hypothetical protein AAY473_024813 [Plecturocebus cupreus]
MEKEDSEDSGKATEAREDSDQEADPKTKARSRVSHFGSLRRVDHLRGHYSAIKRNDRRTHATIRMNLENIASGTITSHGSLNHPGSSDPPNLACGVAGTTGVCHHAHLIFVFFVEMQFSHVAQTSLKLLGSSDPPTLASQTVGITGFLVTENTNAIRGNFRKLPLHLPIGQQVCAPSEHFGRPRRVDHLRSGVLRPDQTTWRNSISTKNTKISRAWWHLPVVLATRESEAHLTRGGWSAVAKTRLTATSISQSSSSPASASRVAGITGVHHHAWLIFTFLVETGFHHFGQAGLKPLTSGDLPASASESAGIKGVSHRTQPLPSLLTGVFHHAGKLRQGDHLSSGVPDQPGQHGKTPSLLRIQKLARK